MGVSSEMATTLGAGQVLTVRGTEYKVSPLSLKQLTEIQKEALQYYKRNYIKTWADNMDLLPNGEAMMHEAMTKASKLEVTDLPMRVAYDCEKVPISKKIKELLVSLEWTDVFDVDGEDAKRYLSTALDREQVTPQDVHRITKQMPKAVRVPYDAWWATSTYEGMACIIHCGLQKHHSEVTKQEILDWSPDDLITAAGVVEDVSSADAGN